ncbi:MAG: plasmid pRiA4b ORF-3 family protein [Prevotellaceae bacterium]|nr:plasmid pRiA4b ORF-3 family protein [Prevotellaceae bacterium]
MLQFKISLRNIGRPRVWRVVVTPNTFSFHSFHCIIQAAFGWENRHLYAFSPSGWYSLPFISQPSREDLRTVSVVDSRKTILGDIFTNEGQRFKYIYDFGDEWMHDLTLEYVFNAPGHLAYCINGRGACPPENSGGVIGYKELKALFTPGQPLTKEARDIRRLFGWAKGYCWNANWFNLDEANLRVIKACREILLQA